MNLRANACAPSGSAPDHIGAEARLPTRPALAEFHGTFTQKASTEPARKHQGGLCGFTARLVLGWQAGEPGSLVGAYQSEAAVLRPQEHVR